MPEDSARLSVITFSRGNGLTPLFRFFPERGESLFPVPTQAAKVQVHMYGGQTQSGVSKITMRKELSQFQLRLDKSQDTGSGN